MRGRMHVHDQDGLASVSRLGEGIQIGKVQAGVPTREPPVGTGVMVRHALDGGYRIGNSLPRKHYPVTSQGVRRYSATVTDPVSTKLVTTLMLSRVALVYGHVWCAPSTRAWATSRSKPGRLTLRRAWRK